MLARGAVRVAIFIDWQNVYWGAREAFGFERRPSGYGNFSPFQLGRLLAAANGRGCDGRLVGVEVFRGQPSPARDRIGYAANRRQAAAWEAEAPGVVVSRTRPLRYPPTYPSNPPVEKGVDVELAVSALGAVLRSRCDVAVVFSHDSDLRPVPEAIADLAGAGCVETAAWIGPTFKQRISPKPVVAHHALTERVFRLVSTPVNYARKQ